MDLATIIALIVKHGPRAAELARKYGPLAAKFVRSLHPVVEDATQEGGHDPFRAINAVLSQLGREPITRQRFLDIEKEIQERSTKNVDG